MWLWLYPRAFPTSSTTRSRQPCRQGMSRHLVPWCTRYCRISLSIQNVDFPWRWSLSLYSWWSSRRSVSCLRIAQNHGLSIFDLVHFWGLCSELSPECAWTPSCLWVFFQNKGTSKISWLSPAHTAPAPHPCHSHSTCSWSRTSILSDSWALPAGSLWSQNQSDFRARVVLPRNLQYSLRPHEQIPLSLPFPEVLSLCPWRDG